jgi:hypothetical protein
MEKPYPYIMFKNKEYEETVQSTCFIKGKTSYGRYYHKFCSWRATISTILNNATAQYFPVATQLIYCN